MAIAQDADWQRKITKRLATALDRMVGEAESLQRHLQEPLTPAPGSVFARQAPPLNDDSPAALARCRLWQFGLGELHVRLAVALDATRAVRVLTKADGGIVISPLILARTVLEAMVDTHAYLDGKPHVDRALRFYAGIARDVNRVINPVMWKEEHFDSLDRSVQGAFDWWSRVQADAEIVGYGIETVDAEDGNPSYNLAVIGRDGKRVACAPKTASALANIDRDLLHSWNLASGMAHGATWIAGAELGHAADGTSRGMPWMNAVLLIADCLGRICDLNAEFLGWPTGYAGRFADEVHRLAPTLARAAADIPGDGLWHHMTMNIPKQ